MESTPRFFTFLNLFYIRKMLHAFHKLPPTLSACEWFKPESGDSGGTEELFELPAGYTAPALQLLVIRQPKAVSRIAEAPWVMARQRSVNSCSLWSNWESMAGWIPAPHQTLTWTSMHPNKGNTDVHSRWEVRIGDLAYFKWKQQNHTCVSSCYGFTHTVGWEIEIGTFQGFCLLEDFNLWSPPSVMHTGWHNFDAQGKGHTAPPSVHKLLRNYENRGHQMGLPHSECHG